MKKTLVYRKDVQIGTVLIAFNVTIVYNDSCEEEKLTVLKQSFGFAEGDALTDEDVDALRESEQVFFAVMHGLRLLSYSDCSVKRLAEKLRSKGHPLDIAVYAAKAVESLGYINEREQVVRRARVHASKLKGQRLIITELSAEGYRREIIAVWLKKDRTDYAALCKREIEKKGGLPEDYAEKRKLISHLYRRGFSRVDMDVAERLISEELDGEDGTED